MTIDLKDRVEMTRLIYSFCVAQRRKKRMPQLSAAASEREMQFARELNELEELHKQEGNAPSQTGAIAGK